MIDLWDATLISLGVVAGVLWPVLRIAARNRGGGRGR